MQDYHDRPQTTTRVLDRPNPPESNRPSSDSDPPSRRPRKRRLLRVALSFLVVVLAVSADYLRQLALSGRLRAVRHRSLWLSSHAALQEYMDSRSPRGRR